MKNLIYIIMCIAAFVCSCSNISEDDRFIYVKPADVSRCVLLEDFTGQNCINCPNAADEIHKIQELYGEDNVIAVAIHGGPLAFAGNAKNLGFKTDLCDEYYNAAKVEANPSGRIDRQGAPSSIVEEWQSLVASRIQSKAPLSLQAEVQYNDNDRKADVKVTAMGTDGNTDGKIQAWIVEDGIVAAQKMPDGSTNREYVHNHVLRAAVNGTWGTDFSIKEGQTREISLGTTLDGDWNAANCSVVVFVYNSQGVMQVTKSPIIPKNITN